jgi:hypothetical protein
MFSCTKLKTTGMNVNQESLDSTFRVSWLENCEDLGSSSVQTKTAADNSFADGKLLVSTMAFFLAVFSQQGPLGALQNAHSNDDVKYQMSF